MNMIYIVLISVIAVVVLSIWYAKRVEDNPEHPYNSKDKNKNDISQLEDDPIGFGYKTTWFAIKTNNQEQVANFLNLKDLKKANWKSGLDNSYNKQIFITPNIDNWILVVGNSLPSGDSDESIEKVKLLLEKLSREFGEAQFFSTHRVVEFHCWIKATNGAVDRIYSYLGESGENIEVSGKATNIEKKYNLINYLSPEAQQDSYIEREDLIYPDEELVMTIAGDWSINPTTLDDRRDIKGLGLLGRN